MLRNSGCGWRGYPPSPTPLFLCKSYCAPPQTPPLQKHKYSSKVSHMQCPLTIGFTSSDLSLAYFLRQGGEGLEGKRGGEEAPASSSMFQAILSPSASIQAEGFEEVARKNSSHTLQGEEGQEESQHPDTVQPVGPHASLSLAPLPLPFSPSLRFSLSLNLSSPPPPSLLSKENGICVSLQSPWALLYQL